MNLMKFAAMAAVAMAVVPAFAQETTTTQETVPVNNQNNPMMQDWSPGMTLSEDQIIMNTKYLNSHDEWVLWKMLNRLPFGDEQVLLQAMSNAMLFNRTAAMRTWSSAPAGTTVITTTTVTTDPTISTSASGQSTTTTTVQTGTSRNQAMAGAAMWGVMGDVEAYDLLARDLDAQDRTAFRALWPTLTSTQQDVLLKVVKLTADPNHWRSEFYRSTTTTTP